MNKSDEEIRKNRAYFLFDFKWINLFDKLDDANSGKLIKAVMHYAKDKVVPNWVNDDSRLAISFDVITPNIDENTRKYIETCKNRSKRTGNGKGNDKEPNYDSDAYKQMATNPQYIPKKK